jgi:small-conductance mechanosensitive channel
MDPVVDAISTWLKQHDTSLVPVLASIALLIGASVLISLLRQLLKRSLGSLETRFRWSYETTLTIACGVTAALWLMVATLLLELWGVGLGGIWTVLVSIATVIGVGFLASWTMVSNVTASVFIAIRKPFHLGDTGRFLPKT